MKRLILIILAAVLTAGAWSQDSLSISLLTCSQGRDVSSAFGHSALRVKDYAHGRDLVFNYGTFSFNEPNFFLKFLKGDLNYFLSVNSFDAFKRSYDAVGRGIIEQPLSLTPAQAAGIYAFLIDNYKPANRYYLYDFLQDNCATRIRDVFDRDGFSITDTLTGYTYRDELTRLVGDRRWMMFGIDLILGAGTDREITVRESAFLPDRLSEVLMSYSNTELEGTPLASAGSTLSSPAQHPLIPGTGAGQMEGHPVQGIQPVHRLYPAVRPVPGILPAQRKQVEIHEHLLHHYIHHPGPGRSDHLPDVVRHQSRMDGRQLESAVDEPSLPHPRIHAQLLGQEPDYRPAGGRSCHRTHLLVAPAPDIIILLTVLMALSRRAIYRKY